MTSDSINGYKQKSNVKLDIETMELKKLARVRMQIPDSIPVQVSTSQLQIDKNALRVESRLSLRVGKFIV